MDEQADSGKKDAPAPENEADVQQASAVEQADVALGTKLARNRDHPAVKAAGFASKIGDQGPLYVLSGALFFTGVALRHRKLAGSGVAMLAACGLADLSKSLTKRLVRRTRPHVLLEEDRYKADPRGGSEQKTEQSFPSGHTAGSVAAARALSRNFPEAGVAAGVAAVAIGIARVAKGAHWPLDIVAGAVVGLMGEGISATLLNVLWRGAQQLADNEKKPWRR